MPLSPTTTTIRTRSMRRSPRTPSSEDRPNGTRHRPAAEPPHGWPLSVALGRTRPPIPRTGVARARLGRRAGRGRRLAEGAGPRRVDLAEGGLERIPRRPVIFALLHISMLRLKYRGLQLYYFASTEH